MSKIIDFKTALERRPPVEGAEPAAEQFPETKRQRSSRKRNPLTRLHNQAGIAMRVAGRLHRGEALRVDDCCDERGWLRRGAESARLLADELARLVQEMEVGQ